MTNKGRIIVILLIVVLSICMTGCITEYADWFVNGFDEEGALNMTEEEKELLLNSEPSTIGKEWIESGNLGPDQKIDIEYIREMKEYLKRKYPSYDIEITKFSPATSLFSAQMHSYTFFLKYDGKDYKAKIYLSEDKEPEFADNFYSFLYREEYDRMVIELLEDNGYTVQSYTVMDNMAGEEINETKTVEEALTIYPQFSRLTHIFFPGEFNQEVADRIKQIMQNSILGADCFLYFMGDDTYDTAEEYENNRLKLENGHLKYKSIVF